MKREILLRIPLLLLTDLFIDLLRKDLNVLLEENYSPQTRLVVFFKARLRADKDFFFNRTLGFS